MQSIKRDFGRYDFQDGVITALGWDDAVLRLVLEMATWADEDDPDLYTTGDGELQFFDTDLLNAVPPLEDDLWGYIGESEILALHPVATLDAGRAHGMELIVHLPPRVAAHVSDPVMILSWRSKGFEWMPFE